MAGELTGHVRASDTVARLGGDEFGVLLWNLGEPQAIAKARELEALIEAVSVPHGDARLSVGASVGIAPLSVGPRRTRPSMPPTAPCTRAKRNGASGSSLPCHVRE